MEKKEGQKKEGQKKASPQDPYNFAYFEQMNQRQAKGTPGANGKKKKQKKQAAKQPKPPQKKAPPAKEPQAPRNSQKQGTRQPQTEPSVTGAGKGRPRPTPTKPTKPTPTKPAEETAKTVQPNGAKVPDPKPGGTAPAAPSPKQKPSRRKEKPAGAVQQGQASPKAKRPKKTKQPKKPRPVPTAKSRDFPADPLPKKRRKQFESPEERKKYMQRMRMVAALSGSFLAVIVLMVLCLTVFFKIDTVQVSGVSRYSAEQITQACHLGNGQNLFTLNEAAVVEQIEKDLPYIKSVTITRALPSTIQVEVQDETVVGGIQTENGFWILGSDGKALEWVETLPEGCTVLVGLQLNPGTEVGKPVSFANEAQKQSLEAFCSIIQNGEIGSFTQIDFTDVYNITAVYDGRITMKFGTATNMEYKLRFAKAVLDSGKIMANQKGTLDLSLAEETDKVYFNPDYSITVTEGTTTESTTDSAASGETTEASSGETATESTGE